ncbi:MAG: hypothetical protein HPKKFMNG_01157 [Planctomycetes bacterium]|nr:hypothetical protein [Planctomycetota bacterium]HRJ78970.1 hypothetical protein [Planctomycetota bacterium]
MIAQTQRHSRPTRAEVEKACLIFGIGKRTLTIDGLVRTLGLHVAHVPAISNVIEQVAMEGLIEHDAGTVRVTLEGKRWLSTMIRRAKGE